MDVQGSEDPEGLRVFYYLVQGSQVLSVFTDHFALEGKDDCVICSPGVLLVNLTLTLFFLHCFS